MNFSFDESGGMGSKAHSEENFNLLCFLVLSSKNISCDTYSVRIFLLKDNIQSMFECKAEFLSVCTSHIKTCLN